MLLNNNKQDNTKFDTVKSEFEAYKRWGYAAAPPSPAIPDEEIGNLESEIVHTNNENEKTKELKEVLENGRKGELEDFNVVLNKSTIPLHKSDSNKK